MITLVWEMLHCAMEFEANKTEHKLFLHHLVHHLEAHIHITTVTINDSWQILPSHVAPFHLAVCVKYEIKLILYAIQPTKIFEKQKFDTPNTWNKFY